MLLKQMLNFLNKQMLALNVDVKFSDLEKDTILKADRFRVFGVQWEPLEFLRQTEQARHPLSGSESIPSELLEAVRNNASQSQFEVVKSRTLFFKRWLSPVRDLEEEECCLRRTMDPLVNTATKGKR